MPPHLQHKHMVTLVATRANGRNFSAFNFHPKQVFFRSPGIRLTLSLIIMTLVSVSPVLNLVIPSSTASSVYTSKLLSASSLTVATVDHSTSQKSNNKHDGINININNDNTTNNNESNLSVSSEQEENNVNIVNKSQSSSSVSDDILQNVMSSDSIYVTSDTCDWTGSGISDVDSLVQLSPRSIVPVHLRCNSGTIRWKYPRNGLRVTLNSNSPFKGCIKVSSLLAESFVMSTLVHHRSYRQRRQLNPQTHSLYPVRISLESKNATTGANTLTNLYDPFDGKSIDLLRCFTSQQGNSVALFVEALTPLNVQDASSSSLNDHHISTTSVNNNSRQQLHASVIDESTVSTSSNHYSTSIHPSSIILPSIKETFRFDYHLMPLTSEDSTGEATSILLPASSPVASEKMSLDECEACSDKQILESFCTSDFVLSGVVKETATVHSLERSELTVAVDNLWRDVSSDPSHLTSSSQLKWKTSKNNNNKKLITVLHEKCERKKGIFNYGKFIFTGNWILGNPIVKCAVSARRFNEIKVKALENGSNLCQLN